MGTTTGDRTKAKSASRRAGPRQAGPRKAGHAGTGPETSGKHTSTDFTARLQAVGRNAFLASLGFYGKAFDEVQEQFNSLQQQLEERRALAGEIYSELVKRGRKVEKDAIGALEDFDLPGIELESLTDRKRLDDQLAQARARFKQLKASVGFQGTR